jgi:hypothetical protein
MQEAFEKDQAIFTSDEYQGDANVHIGKSRDRLQALPELQALASAHADIQSMVIATNGAEVSRPAQPPTRWDGSTCILQRCPARWNYSSQTVVKG